MEPPGLLRRAIERQRSLKGERRVNDEAKDLVGEQE